MGMFFDMELKRYQERTLEKLGEWFECLDLKDNSPAAAWEAMDKDEHKSRKDSANRQIPHICLKVPTGGGKTLLAAETLVKCNRPTGLVLWAVPNKAIYTQTKQALWDRNHPYRIALERASGRRVKVMEKDENLSCGDVENYLCVLLLSLQAANRRNNKEFLKMFQETGKYSSFFPDIDDDHAIAQIVKDHPGLEKTSDGRVLRTLANVFKICRPVIILDEAHKAYGSSFDENQFNKFDPSFILELSATPDSSKSNVLVNIGGQELKEEEMIKLPIEVTGHSDSSWQNILRDAGEQLEILSEQADQLYENTGSYIRPMAVVRVDRTGRNQRKPEYLHAEDVRAFLVSSMGVPADQVRVQSSDTKELEGEDILSENCCVRWIITKDALKEGWDCSYAYILILLDNTKAKTTVTQMMGRVLRQPQAQRTEIAELDSCYVHCNNASVDEAVEVVKRELQAEGFGDCSQHIRSTADAVTQKTSTRRNHITQEMTRLPQVLYEGKEIDYQQHILATIDWNIIKSPSEWDLPKSPNVGGTQTVDFDTEGISSTNKKYVNKKPSSEIDLAWYVMQLRTAIPNAWQAARIVQEAVENLQSEGHGDEWISERRSAFIRAIEHYVGNQVDQQAEKVFIKKLQCGEITFDLELPFEYEEWYELQAPAAELGINYQKSLFAPMYNYGMNTLEKKYAGILDSNPAIKWWHRVAARQPGEYRLQGWRKDFVYPDFVAIETGDKIFIHEPKGKDRSANEDTHYKQRLLKCLEKRFNSQAIVTVHNQNVTADFKIIFENDL